MNFLWYVQTHVRKDLGESSHKMDMSLDMSPEILRNVRGTMLRMNWNLLPLFTPSGFGGIISWGRNLN
jgi:hypothetical protein